MYDAFSLFEICNATCCGPPMRNTLVGSFVEWGVAQAPLCSDRHTSSHVRALFIASLEPINPETGSLIGKACGHRVSPAQNVSR